MAEAINCIELSPFGARLDVDLAGPLDEDTRQCLRETYQRHGWILIPGQNLSMEQQIEVCRIFGPIVDSPLENFYVSNVRPDGFLGTREFLFHSDVPFLPLPYEGASLHAIDVSPGVTPTRFVNACDVYERLPQALRERIGGMMALQARQRNEGYRTRLTDLKDGDMCTAHAVVRREAASGRPYLFVNQDMTACIVGLSEAESDALLEELFGYLYAEEHVLEHPWQAGDIVIWNNLSVQHARKDITGGARTLQRVTIAKLGYLDQYPADTITEELHNDTLLADQEAG